MNKSIRFVYHLWIPDNDIFDNDIYNVHIKCIKKYSDIFNDVLIVLSCNDNISDEVLNRLKEEFFLIFNCPKIEIKVIENNPLIREAETLYNEIFLKLNDYDGITFFAHSKGLQNMISGTYNNGFVNKDSLIEWICGMYFLNLEYVKEVKKTLIGDLRIAYGGLLSRNTNMWGMEQWQYNGGFFWLNTKKLYDYIKINNKYVPQCTDRSYAENALWKILPFNFNYIESHKTYYIDTDVHPEVNPYLNSDIIIRSILPDKDDIESFIEVYSSIVEDI